jgi:alkyldihydroxyacetonephosphate synthase
MARRKHWGWGLESEQPSAAELRAAASGLRTHLGFGREEVEDPVPLERVRLAAPRVEIPGALGRIATAEPYDRARYGLGRSYLDVVGGMRGEVPHPPDFVVHAREEADVERTLEWAAEAGVAVTPVGGGTSVVGGVEARPGPGQVGAIALALGALDRLLEVDPVSRAARLQAGATGPRLEQQLREHGLTLRFYPQSFELATLGGWIATRAGGHFATGPTHVDDLVESVRAVTPGTGVWESRRLPGSGAGPSPDRLLLGSEGTLGVITEAWVRVQPPPVHRRSASVRFPTFGAGAAALREIVQAGLWPANARLIDAREARLTFAGDGSAALLVLGFEGADDAAPVGAAADRALAICAARGGTWEASAAGGGAGAWRDAFLRAPYLRDTLVAMGVLSETFETAITWERFDAFVDTVRGETEAALRERCGDGQVTVRVTHAYPDGAAPYFTCLAPVERGEEAETWHAVKGVAGGAILRAGGTITHHHAVGRDHRPWYDRQRPDPFAAALRGAKAAVDPRGILNPGVLIG